MNDTAKEERSNSSFVLGESSLMEYEADWWVPGRDKEASGRVDRIEDKSPIQFWVDHLSKEDDADNTEEEEEEPAAVIGL